MGRRLFRRYNVISNPVLFHFNYFILSSSMCLCFCLLTINISIFSFVSSFCPFSFWPLNLFVSVLSHSIFYLFIYLSVFLPFLFCRFFIFLIFTVLFSLTLLFSSPSDLYMLLTFYCLC